jgi:hypothetical protein
VQIGYNVNKNHQLEDISIQRDCMETKFHGLDHGRPDGSCIQPAASSWRHAATVAVSGTLFIHHAKEQRIPDRSYASSLNALIFIFRYRFLGKLPNTYMHGYCGECVDLLHGFYGRKHNLLSHDRIQPARTYDHPATRTKCIQFEQGKIDICT